jgi:predicted nucleic acid-binding protein
MWLLDTAAISESSKPRANSGFLAWLDSGDPDSMSTSVLCLAEIHRGIVLLAPGEKRLALTAWMDREFSKWFGPRILPVDRAVALAWADFGARGATHPVDALIGATAKAHGLVVVTRNTRDFDGLGVPVINPWTPA